MSAIPGTTRRSRTNFPSHRPSGPEQSPAPKEARSCCGSAEKRSRCLPFDTDDLTIIGDTDQQRPAVGVGQGGDPLGDGLSHFGLVLDSWCFWSNHRHQATYWFSAPGTAARGEELRPRTWMHYFRARRLAARFLMLQHARIGLKQRVCRTTTFGVPSVLAIGDDQFRTACP